MGFPESPSWMAEAACHHRTATFYGHHPETAKRICAGCPVRVECLDYALALEEDVGELTARYLGVWGGLSSPERAELRATRRRLKETA